jgi:hypothetical protein
MASTQRRFVKGSIYHLSSPSGIHSDIEHLGSFKLDGEKILMFKMFKLLKLKRREKPKAGK